MRRTRRTTLPALAEIARTAIAAPQLRDALQVLTEGARLTIGAHYAVLSETSGAQFRQSVRALSLSAEYARSRQGTVSVDRLNLHARVCEMNRPERLSEAQVRVHPARPPMRNWLAAPLVSRSGDNLGVIQLCDKLEGEFDEEDEAALVLLAQFASAAIKRDQAWREEAQALEALNSLRRSVQRELAARTRIESALRASEARFRMMADSAPVMIWMADTAKSCTWVNKAWLDFTGRTLEEELGFRWTESVHPEDLQTGRDIFTRHFEAREPFRIEYRLRRRDGQYRWVVDTPVPLFEGPDKSFSGYIGSCIDITEFKEAALDREQLLESERAARGEAERLGRMKDEFLATLSHELRTPLNAMLGWATLLRRIDPGSPDHTKGLETIERNARVQAQIINDLLDMSRIISGKVQLDVQLVNLPDVVSAAIDSIRPAVEAKRLTLRSTLDVKLSPIRADPHRLQQVLWNLLTNAVKFTPPGGRIDVVLERVSSHVEIAIEDTGIGIKPEFLSFAFDRFRQADSSTTRRHGGLGLGLSIVKHLVELHGGSVRVKSPGEGQGATFIVNLPLSVIRTDDWSREERPQPAGVDLLTVELPSLAGITALVVDDELDARVLVSSLIEERGGRAISASGALEALEILARERVDILVSDIGMPDMDGYELIQRVRALDASDVQRMPAIALTAYARADDRQRSLLAGYQMHLAKPVEARELVAGIASLLRLAALKMP